MQRKDLINDDIYLIGVWEFYLNSCLDIARFCDTLTLKWRIKINVNASTPVNTIMLFLLNDHKTGFCTKYIYISSMFGAVDEPLASCMMVHI